MCGRYTLTNPEEALAEALDGPTPAEAELRPRYNIAPSEPVLAVRQGVDESAREPAWLRWGLIPPRAEGPEAGYRMINARAETVPTRGLFKASLRSRRCLILADGFYEWRRIGRSRQPYYFRLAAGRPFAFAGLWATWRGKGRRIESCTLITTEANRSVAPIHDRMPVILLPQSYGAWLGDADEEEHVHLLEPHQGAELERYAVSPAVNRAGQEDASFIEPVPPPGENLSLFD